jgi:putative peptidoglycan lipid II flippase
VWTTRAYLVGLLAQCLLEVVTRAFYAKQNAITPLKATAVRVALFLTLSIAFIGTTGAIGLAFIDSITITVEVAILCWMLYKIYPAIFSISHTIYRVMLGSAISVAVILAVMLIPLPPLIILSLALLSGTIVYFLFVRQDLKILIKL